MIRLKSAGWSMVILLFLFNIACAEVLLIGNNSISETSVSKSEVKRIFLGKMKKWNDGSKIRPVTLKRGAIHEEFMKDFVNKTASAFSSFWKRAIVSGTGIPPKSFVSEEEVVNYVSSKPGTLGYISPDTPHEGVKVISVQ